MQFTKYEIFMLMQGNVISFIVTQIIVITSFCKLVIIHNLQSCPELVAIVLCTFIACDC